MRLLRRFPFVAVAVVVEALFVLGGLWGPDNALAAPLVIPGYVIHLALAVTILPARSFWVYATVVVAAGLAADLLVGWAVPGSRA